ncbi:hypothetical protein VHEMI09967 [[Torrubiella] hemipterigena]|uniref:Uncharacterized protein n=1 Tax=[Torrubiella] hemipterigena TaxID=1531966 RepID=A0A0A1TR95_9HYPO|nr:hypothetical protein VHEMI09967 [[Torrubiella] hemipterigena]
MPRQPKPKSKRIEFITISDSDTPSKPKRRTVKKKRPSRSKKQAEVIHIDSDAEPSLFNPHQTLFAEPINCFFPPALKPVLIIPPTANKHLTSRSKDRLSCAKSLHRPLENLCYGLDCVLTWTDYVAFGDLQTEIHERLEDHDVAMSLGVALRNRLIKLGNDRLKYCQEHNIPLERLFIGRGGLPVILAADMPAAAPQSIVSLTSAALQIPSPSIVFNVEPMCYSSSFSSFMETDPHAILDIETTLQPRDTRHIVHDVDVYGAGDQVNKMDFEVYLAPPDSEICDTQAIEMVVDNVEALEAKTGDLGGVDIEVYDESATSASADSYNSMYQHGLGGVDANMHVYDGVYKSCPTLPQQDMTTAIDTSIHTAINNGLYYNNWITAYTGDAGPDVDLYSAD